MNLEKKNFEEQKEKLLKNNDYMNWLENFTNRYPSFYEYDWVLEGCSEEDIQNIQNIDVLYEVIEDYAVENYFKTTLENKGAFYLIKCNDVGYKVGMQFGNSKFYCERTEVTEEAINFGFIQTNTKHRRSYFIDTQFYYITDAINKLMELGMDLDSIEEQLQITVHKCGEQGNKKRK